MRFRTLILAAVLLSAAGFGLWKLRESHLAAARRADDWQYQQRIAATEAALDQPIEFSSERWLALYELADFLRAQTNLDIEVNEEAWQAEGVKVETPLPRIQGRFSLRSALALLLEQRDVTYDIGDSRLILTTSDASRDENQLRTVVYPLPQPEHVGGEVDESSWADLVIQNFEPWDWTDVGGRWHCEAVPGALVITHCEAAHRQIQRLMDSLERLDSPPESWAAVPLHPFLAEPSERRIATALAQPVSGNYDAQPLREVIADLARQHSIPFLMNEHKLQESGIEGNELITVHLDGVTLASALRQILDIRYLTFEIRHELLIITTGEDAESPDHMPLVAHPVHDLVNWPAAPDYDALIELIETAIAPESWYDVGGPGSTREFNGWLIFYQRADIHAEVERLLADLRRALEATHAATSLAAPFPSLVEQRIEKALRQLIPMRFVEEPLNSALERISKQTGITIAIDGRSLEDVEMRPDVRVNCDLAAAPLRNQLRLLLDEHDLTFTVRHERLLVTTPEQAEQPEYLQPRIYDARPLFDPDLGVTDADELLDLITTLIRPEDWVDVGGPGSIKEFQGLLVVSADDETHQQLSRLLAGLKSHCLRTVKPGVKRPTVVKFDATAGEAAIEAALAKTVNVDLSDVTLESALMSLATEHGLPLVLDRRRIVNEAIVVLEEKVSLKLADITLRSALRHLLQPIGLTWRMRDEVLYVTTSEPRNDLPIVAYRVSDLWDKRPNYDGLIEVITTAIAPERWVDVGGTGAVKEIDGWLLVAHEHAVHVRVEQLLEQLRRTLGEAPGLAVRNITPRTAMEDRIHAALQQDIALDFENRPMAEVVDYIAAHCDIPPIRFNATLTTAGYSREKNVSCRLGAAPLAIQLKLLLEPLSLTFVVQDESLLITSPEAADDPNPLPIRIYDVRPLVDPDAGIGTQEELIEHIQSLIAPDSWTDTGGPGSISEFRGLLVVSQTEEVHEQLTALLAALGEHAVGKFVPRPDWQGFVDVRPNRTEQRIEAALAEPVDIDLCGEPLEQALDRLADCYDLPLVIDERSTEWELWPMRLVTYSAHGQRLAHMLDRLLLPHSLTYDVRHNVLLIRAIDEVHQPCEMRLYHTAGIPLTDTSDSWPLPNHFMPQDNGDAWGTEGGQARLRRLTNDWLAVIAPIRVQDRIADRLVELRTGAPPPRELARRELARELEILSRHPEPRLYGRDWDRAAAEDPFR
jgi:hypothetical protein